MFAIQLDLNYSFLPLQLLDFSNTGETWGKNSHRYLPDPRTDTHTQMCTHVHTHKDKLNKLFFLYYTEIQYEDAQGRLHMIGSNRQLSLP